MARPGGGLVPRETVRVLVVDDSAAARRALGEVVTATDGFVLVGSTASGEDALRLLPQVEPQLVLLDVRMPGLDGHATARLMTVAHPQVAIVRRPKLCEPRPGTRSGELGSGTTSHSAPRHSTEARRTADAART